VQRQNREEEQQQQQLEQQREDAHKRAARELRDRDAIHIPGTSGATAEVAAHTPHTPAVAPVSVKKKGVAEAAARLHNAVHREESWGTSKFVKKASVGAQWLHGRSSSSANKQPRAAGGWVWEAVRGPAPQQKKEEVGVKATALASMPVGAHHPLMRALARKMGVRGDEEEERRVQGSGKWGSQWSEAEATEKQRQEEEEEQQQQQYAAAEAVMQQQVC
jgi:hypothetical protein